MATMAMDTARKPNKRFYSKPLISVITLLSTVFNVQAGEWTFDPQIIIDETYSDNVELDQINSIGSFVNRSTLGINSQFKSRLAEFSFDGRNTFASYSHNHALDDSFKTLNTNARYSLWANGLAITASATIANQNKNGANNSLADIVSGDTVETKNYQAGLEYNVTNSRFSIESSWEYQIRKAADNIGESNGYIATIKTQNGNSARNFLWQLSGNYSERHNNDLTGRIHNVEALAGIITDIGFSPFVRYFNEDSTGNFGSNRNTGTSSWGPGIRWRVASHFNLDLSYNYVADKTKSDNYISATVNWQPSTRTTLEASYNKRFFGDSYKVNFQHKIRRLTNSLTYNETVEAFDRNSFRQISLGNFWCPNGASVDIDVSACLLDSNTNIDFDNYQLVTLLDQVLVEGNEFSLNKVLAWQSSLNLSRTTFRLDVNNTNRESLTTNRVEDLFNGNFSVSRKISGKSDLKLAFNFRHQHFDKNSTEGNGQEDYYRSISTTYSRKLASSLSGNISLQYLDRNSTQQTRTYTETRAIINITKEF